MAPETHRGKALGPQRAARSLQLVALVVGALEQPPQLVALVRHIRECLSLVPNIVMALYSYGLYSYGLHSYGLYLLLPASTVMTLWPYTVMAYIVIQLWPM